jgi:hypothetical protein
MPGPGCPEPETTPPESSLTPGQSHPTAQPCVDPNHTIFPFDSNKPPQHLAGPNRPIAPQACITPGLHSKLLPAPPHLDNPVSQCRAILSLEEDDVSRRRSTRTSRSRLHPNDVPVAYRRFHAGSSHPQTHTPFASQNLLAEPDQFSATALVNAWLQVQNPAPSCCDNKKSTAPGSGTKLNL